MRWLAAAFVFLLAALPASAAPSLVTFRDGRALDGFEEIFKRDRRETADPDAWRYLSAEVKGAIQALEQAHGFHAIHGYSRVLRGFSADLTDEQIQALRKEPMIKSITVTVNMASTEAQAAWGVSRVRNEDPTVAAPKQEPHDPVEIKGVTVYVVDSGIDASSADLNVVKEVNFAGGSRGDCNGHGTHVAGTIGARDNGIGITGVAPGVPLVSVKVIDCNGAGSSAGIIKGLDWVVAHATKPAVINLSLGGGQSSELDAAVQATAAAGIFLSIAAGNNAADACLASPALNGSTAGIMTVSAVDAADGEATFSNFGGCVDIWAPGVAIPSTFIGPAGLATLSGTSMAAPHVAGAAALYLSLYPKALPSEVESSIIGSSVIPGTASKDGRTILRLQIPPS